MRQTSKSTKQSKLMRFISSPIRSLTKAKNFYMRSLEDCAAKVGNNGGGYTASQVPRLPRSFSANSTATSNDDEDLRWLLRTISTSKKKNDYEEKGNKNKKVEGLVVNQVNDGMGMRSYSVGLKMGRIDEEMASTFEEDEVNKRPAGFV